MRFPHWLLLVVALGISSPVLGLLYEMRSHHWCTDAAKVRKRLAEGPGDGGKNLAQFVHCDRATVPILIDALKDKKVDFRWSAAWALRNMGAEAKEAVPALIVALKDEKSSVRWNAAWALGSIGPEAKDAVPALIATLKDENLEVRSGAAKALGQIGAEIKEVVPTLIPVLKDKSLHVRETAAYALKQLVISFYRAAENPEQLEEAKNLALTVKQALKDTDFEIPKQDVNQVLLDIAER